MEASPRLGPCRQGLQKVVTADGSARSAFRTHHQHMGSRDGQRVEMYRPNSDKPRYLELCTWQVTVTKGHRAEGGFINRSLLTLGTVIAKLSEGGAAHVPFR